MDRFQECGCGCGRSIELVNWDIDGADHVQPEGFYDEKCMDWYSNECGIRARRMCEACVAYTEAEALISLATTIRDNLTNSNERPADALSALRDMLPVESSLGRRLRRMIAKAQRPVVSLESCDEATCRECQQGAA